MKYRKLRDIEVSAVGIGCMGFSHGYGAIPTEEESIRLMHKAFDLGCTLFDTAEAYGPYTNETLVGKAVKPFRDKIILTTKFVPVFQPGQEIPEGKLSKKGVTNALNDSLKRLQTDYIDIYYEHRVPLDSNVEEVAGPGEKHANDEVPSPSPAKARGLPLDMGVAITPNLQPAGKQENEKAVSQDDQSVKDEPPFEQVAISAVEEKPLAVIYRMLGIPFG